jgi:predicted membrane-bound spermidine synthase
MPLTLDSMGALGILLDKHQKDELGRRINQYYKGSLLLPLASFLVVASAIGVFKGELLVIPYFLAHSVALCFLLRSSAIKSQRLASCASLVNTIYAISVRRWR